MTIWQYVCWFVTQISKYMDKCPIKKLKICLLIKAGIVEIKWIVFHSVVLLGTRTPCAIIIESSTISWATQNKHRRYHSWQLVFRNPVDFTWNPADFMWKPVDFMKSGRFHVKCSRFHVKSGRFHEIHLKTL